LPSLPSAAQSSKPAEGAGGSPRWALELEGKLGESASKGASSPDGKTPEPGTPPPVTAPPAPTLGAPAPTPTAATGVLERRQPPKPDAVVMSGFSDEPKTDL